MTSLGALIIEYIWRDRWMKWCFTSRRPLLYVIYLIYMCVCVCVCVCVLCYIWLAKVLLWFEPTLTWKCVPYIYICMGVWGWIKEISGMDMKMDWCHFVLLKKTKPKKRAPCLVGFCCLFPPYPPLFILNQDLRDSVGGEISVPRQLCSNSQTFEPLSI
jgi:hypothetical protein